MQQSAHQEDSGSHPTLIVFGMFAMGILCFAVGCMRDTPVVEGAGKNPAAVVDDKLQASEDADGPGQRYVIDPVQADYLYIVRINECWRHWDNEHTLHTWIQHNEYPTVLSEGLAELGKTHVIEAIEPPSILVNNTTYGYVVRVHPIEQH